MNGPILAFNITMPEQRSWLNENLRDPVVAAAKYE